MSNQQSNVQSGYPSSEFNILDEESAGLNDNYFTANEALTEKLTLEAGSSENALTTVPEASTDANSAESLDAIHQPPQVGKPQVIVRIRPSPNLDSFPTFEVDQQTKTIQIRVDRDRRAQQTTQRKPAPGFIYFPADNVLEENAGQDDTFSTVAVDLVEKAMMGIHGVIVAIGPEASGKSFSLFGLSDRYWNRGIVVRAMEKMFEIKDRRMGDIDFKLGMSIVEVRRDRIRDLLTLAPNELTDVGDRGPKGMHIEELEGVEHGLGLLLRALIGQKLIHQEPYERSHTIVYFEIIGISPDFVQLQSRITIAEIASAPCKTETCIPSSPSKSTVGGLNTELGEPTTPNKTDTQKFKSKQAMPPSRKCCNPGYTAGPLSESIAVRRDIFALEQIFLRANEMYRIRKHFHKLENLGLSMIASEKRRLSSGNNFRQNRLAHCLKDILDTNTEIRILLHVRPDKIYLKSSLEAMRFAERARLVPSNLDDDPMKRRASRTEDQILQEVINDIAPELMHPANVENLNSEKLRIIQEQAVQYFESNIDSMKVCSKDKVKLMFENFRVLWNFLWELELNVTLRKAEEDIKITMEKIGATSSAKMTGDASHKFHDSFDKKGSSGSGGGGADGDDDDGKEAAGKKSGKKGKKEKERKKKKERHLSSKRATILEPDELKPDEAKSDSGKHGSNHDGVVGNIVAGGGETIRVSSQPTPDGAAGNDVIKGETEVANTSPPTTNIELTPPANEGLEIANAKISAGNLTDTGKVSSPIAAPAEIHFADDPNNPNSPLTGEPVEGSHNNRESIRDKDRKRSSFANKSTLSTGSNTHIHHDAAMRHNSTFFVKGGFADFQLHNIWGDNQDQKALTEEKRQLLAAQQEQEIASKFEEMKKIARRQAIHLLRTGIRRPQWQSLF